MGRQGFSETLAWATNPGVAVANDIVERILFPNLVVPANYMADGRVLRGTLGGVYSTAGTPSISFGVRWGGVGGTVLCKTALISLPTVTNASWWMQWKLQTRLNGVTGSILGTGLCVVHAGVAPIVGSTTGGAAVTPMTVGGVLNPAPVTVDLTADTFLAVTVTWSVAAAGNTTQGLDYSLEAMN